MRSRSPTNFVGQWHCSHVSRAGRRFSMGVGTGRGYRSNATAITCQVPESFDLTNQFAPGPMWHSVHATRACGERLYAVYSGLITEWHAPPQKSVESITSTLL